MINKIKNRILSIIKWSIFGIKFYFISKKNKPEGSKKGLFIDCGSNLGQGYTYFMQFFQPQNFDVLFLEPNPYCMKQVKEKFSYLKNAQFLERAVWVREEKLKFFGLVEDSRGSTSDGGSIISNHNGAQYQANKEDAIEVLAISFSDLLAEKSKEYQKIIVKMDIESSEYEVLMDVIAKGTLKHISHIIIEFHSQYFDVSERKNYQDLETKLITKINEKGIGLTIWI
jgi:FkbM family methyltransferase